jgi:phospholipase/carboxylesterase
VNGGMQMQAWYDIAEIDILKTEDAQGIQDSANLIRLLIDREHALGITHNRIVLAGFSQGGAMALYTGLRFNLTLGGIVALSSYIPLSDTLVLESQIANQNTPIFMAHGLFDPVVPLAAGQMGREQLEDLGYSVEWHSYPMPHSVLPEEIEDIDRFLAKIL